METRHQHEVAGGLDRDVRGEWHSQDETRGIRDRAAGVLRAAPGKAGATAARLGSEARDHWLPLSLIGSGIAMMIMRNRITTMPIRTTGLGETLSRGVRRRPLAAGLLAMLSGLGLGLLFKRSECENRFFGPARDRLMDRARQEISHAAEGARGALEEIRSSVREETQASESESRFDEETFNREFDPTGRS